MAARDPVLRRISARIAAVERHRGSGDPQLDELRADLAAEADRIARAEAIRVIVDAAPLLTAEQREQLRPILTGGIPGGAPHGS